MDLIANQGLIVMRCARLVRGYPLREGADYQ